ncbi:MAG TPA: tRNA (adenosine(37)-N6)-threonylcarbamoyltransferase complex ATPase subunit type 1 TsaE [Ktedonobacterales bacterium]|nr:tRNA (adenosine(37)-N6)-threonylcarbamoyltransferase complex ATPase subunit type 1 TsaE [Ktedonobacterales bacterium]
MSGQDTHFESVGARPVTPRATVIHSGGVERTRALGAALGALLEPGDVMLLEGDLGAGKTALTQGIGKGLDVHTVINSPTFTILKEYSGRLPLYHFDLYRIESPDEVYSLGFEDYFGADGVCVVEWAERGEPGEPGAPLPWPASYLRIRMRADGPQDRQLEVTSAGHRGAQLQAAWVDAIGAVAEER